MSQFLAIRSRFKQRRECQESNEALKHFSAKTIDVVVNSAGYDTIGSVEEFTVDEVQAMFNVNCFSVHKVVGNVLPYM